MTRVVATGTFDILHPGHLWYLKESAKLGDELYVIVARDANIKHKPRPVVPEEQRLIMVSSLSPVSCARLGDLEDMYRPIRDIRPDIITLGCNQYFDPDELMRSLEHQGMPTQVIRISEYRGSAFTSSRDIAREIVRRSQSDKGSGSEKTDLPQRDAL